MKLEIIGCYSPSINVKKKVSCYKIKNKNKIIFLDMGYGTYKDIKKEDLEDCTIIISHNHIDHSYGIIQLLNYFEKHDIKLKNKIDIYMPEKSKFRNLFKLLNSKEYVNVFAVKDNMEILLENLYITFCPTIHKGETYATKILDRDKDKVFVYTADLARVDDRLIEFCKDADCVMLECGHSLDFQPFTLGRYHGYTKDLTSEIMKSSPKKILLTHYKAYATEEKIKKYLPSGEEEKFTIIKQGDVFDL